MKKIENENDDEDEHDWGGHGRGLGKPSSPVLNGIILPLNGWRRMP